MNSKLLASMLLSAATVVVPAQAQTLAGKTADGSWLVSVTLSDEQGRKLRLADLQMDQLYRAELIVRPIDGGAPCPTEVALDATMPAHYHSMSTTPKITGGNCRYVAEGIYFQMAGAWELYIDASCGAMLSRATFPIQLSE